MQRSYRRACRVACVGLTACTIGIDGNESRKAGVVCGNAREMSLDHITCGNLTPRQSLGKRGGRQVRRDWLQIVMEQECTNSAEMTIAQARDLLSH